MKNPTSRAVKLTLGGIEVELWFDLNTFSAFEEKTGVFFLEFVGNVYDAFSRIQEAKGREGKSLPLSAIARSVPAAQLRAFLWAAAHTYDERGEPRWPYSLTQIGGAINLLELPTIVRALVDGFSSNQPLETEMIPKAAGAAAPAPRPIVPETRQGAENGGVPPGPSDEELLGSLEPSSAN